MDFNLGTRNTGMEPQHWARRPPPPMAPPRLGAGRAGRAGTQRPMRGNADCGRLRVNTPLGSPRASPGLSCRRHGCPVAVRWASPAGQHSGGQPLHWWWAHLTTCPCSPIPMPAAVCTAEPTQVAHPADVDGAPGVHQSLLWRWGHSSVSPNLPTFV